MKLISIVTPTFNEEDNIELLISTLKECVSSLRGVYKFEFIIIDNNSTDGTRDIIRRICHKDKTVKAIFNTRNFGHIRSPYWGIMQGQGDAVIYLASDFQDPPELLLSFIKHWESGSKIVYGVKPQSEEETIFNKIRRLYYRILNTISETNLTMNATGFGLYDKRVIEHLREIKDPYPYLRGLVDELGYKITKIDFIQPPRKRGLSKNNAYTLYDIAMLGVISHSKVPLRFSIAFGVLSGVASIILSVLILLMKLFNWESVTTGLAIIGAAILFLFGVMFVVVGVLGEYVISIHTYVKKRPIVVEDERINF